MMVAFEKNSSLLAEMRTNARLTASTYSVDNTKRALVALFGDLGY
jgi:hypothetical protein